MSLTETLSALTAELRSRRHQERFVHACSRHPVLEDFADLRSLVEHLGGPGERDVEKGEALAVAFITEQQAGPSPLWTGLVLLLCTPMLCALRGSVRGDAIDGDELDAMIIAHFLEVVQAHPVEAKAGRTLSALRSNTRRAVFGEVKSEQRQPAPIDPVDLVEMLDDEEGRNASSMMAPSTQELTTKERRQQALALAGMLKRHLGDLLNTEQHMLVVHTRVLGGSLTDFVAGQYPTTTADVQRRHYERLKRQHGRSVQLVRKALAHLRHPPPSAGGAAESALTAAQA
ncbi:MAG: hypothetical protein RLO52_07915 [Sandaracinaceae bacterium]